VTVRLIRRDALRKRDRGPGAAAQVNDAAGVTTMDEQVTDERAAGTGTAWTRGWASRPGVQGLAALVAYSAFWVLPYTRALALHPELPQLDQTSMDPNFYAWSLGWWPYAVSHGLNPLQANVIGIPAGFNLAWVTTVPPLALLMAPVTAAFGPVVSLNLLVAFALPLAAWAAFVLCRRITRRFWPSLAGGTVYGFSAYEINHTVPAHLNLIFSMLLPLMAYLVVLWRDGKLGRAAFISLMTLGMVLQLFLFLETFAQLTLILVTGLPIGYLLARRSVRPTIARLSRHFGVAYAATVVISAPYLYYAIRHQPPGFARNPQSSSLDLANLIVPRADETFGIGWLAHFATDLPSIADAGYVGIPLLVLAVVLGVTTWRSTLTRFLVLMLVVVLLVAVGPELVVGTLHLSSLPWQHLWNLPLARSAFPTRIMVFGYLALAVMVALWLSAPLKRPVLRWLLGLLAIAAIIADFGPIVRSTPPPYAITPAFIATGQYRHYLTPGENVLVVSGRGNTGMLWQADSGFYFRIAGGYINEAITQGTDLPGPIQLLARPSPSVDQGALTYLKQNDIGAIMIEQGYQPRWAGIFTQLGLHGQTVGGVIFYQVKA
jgi:hypothetical protein